MTIDEDVAGMDYEAALAELERTVQQLGREQEDLAQSVRAYMTSRGIDGSRIETVSYGEERPLAQGHDEDAWAQNRRDEFEILDGGEHLKQP